MEKVDKFLYLILQNRNCSDGGIGASSTAAEFLQKSEETIISFIQNDDRSELEFPPLNSFYRRIIHCLGRRYNLVHRVESTNIFNSNSTLRKIYLTKPVGDQKFQGPILKSSDWIVEIERETGIIETCDFKKLKKIRTKKSIEAKSKPAAPKIKILKRETSATNNSTVETTQPLNYSSVSISSLLALENLTLEEKESKYRAARDRIFEGFATEESEDAVDVDATATAKVVGDPVGTTVTDAAVNSITGIFFNNVIHTGPDFANNYVPAVEANAPVVAEVPTKIVNTSALVIDVSRNKSTQHATVLNPEAIPFSFTPVFEELAPEPVIEINHIYIITAAAGQLIRDHFKEIIAAHPTATIKIHVSPADLAFLLLKENNNDVSVCNDKWYISKWIPEFYLD